MPNIATLTPTANITDIVATSNQADIPATTNSLDLRVLRIYSDYYFIQSEMVLREDKEAGE